MQGFSTNKCPVNNQVCYITVIEPTVLHPSPTPKQYIHRPIIHKNTRDTCDVAKLSKDSSQAALRSDETEKKKGNKKMSYNN